jgi:GNAT superfamily N-acetyltransferase
VNDGIQIRRARADEGPLIADILQDAAVWLTRTGQPLWRGDELNPNRIASDAAAGLHWILDLGGESAATIRYQLDDPVAWPEAPPGEAAYLHRLARRERFAGKRLGPILLAWAADHTRRLGRPCLRLDTEASRSRLRALYEAFGFRLHSLSAFGPYHVARYQLNLAANSPPPAPERA